MEIPIIDELKSSIDNNSENNDFEIIKSCEYLVFSGGGAKGIAFVSALETLVNLFNNKYGGSSPNNNPVNSFLSRQKGFGGTSIGAIIAFALCCNINLQRLKELALNSDTWQINHFIKNMNPLRFFNERGLCNHNVLYKHIDQVFAILGVPLDISFIDLHRKTNKLFVCNAWCADDSNDFVMSYQTTPSLRIRDAICMSMCLSGIVIPFPYEGKEFQDGGLRKNYIIDYFPQNKTIGFRIVERPQKPITVARTTDIPFTPIISTGDCMSTTTTAAQNQNRNGIQHVCNIITSLCTRIDEMNFDRLSPNHKISTIPIYTPGFGSLKISVNREEMNLLWEYGKWSVLWYFLGENFVGWIMEAKISKYIKEFQQEARNKEKQKQEELLRNNSIDLLIFKE